MKTILITAVMLCAIIGVNAQQKTVKKAPAKTTTATKSSTKKTVSTKKVTGKTEFDELICYEDGPCTFGIHKGDTLVYAVNAAGKIYDLLVVPNKFDANTVADFNWVTTGAERKTGHVVIGAKAIKSSKRYMNSLPAGELKLSDASFLWFCADNFSEITKKQTTITFDNGTAETFSSPDDDAVVSTINYKGREIALDAFAIENKAEGEPGRKEIWVLNISNNLLMIKSDAGADMQLKEVREKKLKK